ncbi:MAG: hypothetical protein B7Y01_04160 [Xanthobacter sp. 17-67-6]|nr:MAG: hypothetical protein B7Y61_05310 [Rhizobiales bacterium 35-66-30]OYZ89186.1 MAG: hypothetical protein B7Y01_04160 [Xanthobacter sp. 17-67-6]
MLDETGDGGDDGVRRVLETIVTVSRQPMDRRRGKEFGEERHEMFGLERTSPQMASAGFARIARLAAA